MLVSDVAQRDLGTLGNKRVRLLTNLGRVRWMDEKSPDGIAVRPLRLSMSATGHWRSRSTSDAPSSLRHRPNVPKLYLDVWVTRFEAASGQPDQLNATLNAAWRETTN